MRRPILVLLLIVLASPGCAYMMPPQKIPMDRGNYIDAISKSWKEQLLDNLVRMRYGDTLTSLEMTSVTTSYEMDAALTAAYPINWHPLHGTTGFRNVVGVGGSATYQDKPSISYSPIRGDALLKILIEPLPLSKILQSLQTGWAASYIFPCCVRSINGLRNGSPTGQIPTDPHFYDFVYLFQYLQGHGVIRIVIEAPVEPKVTKVPKEFTITLIDERKDTDKNVKEPGVKGGDKPKDGTNTGEEKDKNKKKKDVTPIGCLIWDKERAKSEKNAIESELIKDHNMKQSEEIKYKIAKYEYIKQALEQNKFKEFLWGQASPVGKGLYINNCSKCHGDNGGGNGPMAYKYDPKPTNFDARWLSMWDVDVKIDQALKNKSHEKRVKPAMKPEEVKSVTSYIKKFGNYEEYSIIDGNENPPQPDPDCDKIVMQTRSVSQVLTLLAYFIDMPGNQITEKRAENSSPNKSLNGPVIEKDQLRFKIYHSKEFPSDAFAVVKRGDYWFYIEDKDFDSKDVFTSTVGILSMSETGTSAGTPILTLPVQ